MAKHILSCSFGKDSIATALLALQHGEPLDELVYCEVMFSEEISGELPEHNRFIHETAIPYFEQRGSFFKRLMQHGVQVTAMEYSLRDRVNMFRLARRVERYATRKRRQLPW